MPRKRTLIEADEKELESVFVDLVVDEAPKPRVIGRPFQPGQSGNPGGKAQEAEGLDENLKLVIGKAGARKLARALFDIGVAGSGHVQLAAIQYIFDRLEGRPRTQTPANAPEEDPLALILRKLIDDRSALQGRSYTALRAGPIIEGEVREYPSEGAGS